MTGENAETNLAEIKNLAKLTIGVARTHTAWVRTMEEIDPMLLDEETLLAVNNVGRSLLEMLTVIEGLARERGYEGPTIVPGQPE